MSECVLCNEAITNPLCEECVEQEIEVWLRETKPNLIEGVRMKTYEISLNRGDTNCIKCDNKMSVCTYCYRQHILNWLSKHPEMAAEFKRFFDLNLLFYY